MPTLTLTPSLPLSAPLVEPAPTASAPIRRREYALLLAICLCFAVELSFFAPRATAVDAGQALSEGNPRNQLVYGLAYLAIGLLMYRKHVPVAAILARVWPLTAVIGFAVVSAAWSEYPEVTVRRSIGLVGTTAVGLYLGWRLEPKALIVLLARVCAICMVFSLLIVLLMPERGTMEHGSLAGNWRGMYRHKNILGVTAAVSVVCIWFAAQAQGGFSRFWLAMLGVSVLNILGSSSTTALGSLLGMAAHLEGKGVVTQDAGGLAQKGGATWSHIQIANRPEAIYTTKVDTAKADLIIGCDPIVTAGKETVLRMREGRTHVALNAYSTPTAAFVHNANWQNPADACAADGPGPAACLRRRRRSLPRGARPARGAGGRDAARARGQGHQVAHGGHLLPRAGRLSRRQTGRCRPRRSLPAAKNVPANAHQLSLRQAGRTSAA